MSNSNDNLSVLASWNPCEDLNKQDDELCLESRSNRRRALLGVPIQPTPVSMIIAVHTSCDSRTAIVLVSEGSDRVKTATLSFKLNQVLRDSSSLRVQASPKRTLTKGGEYDNHTFGYNQLLSGGTVTTSPCTGVCTTLYYIAQIF